MDDDWDGEGNHKPTVVEDNAVKPPSHVKPALKKFNKPHSSISSTRSENNNDSTASTTTGPKNDKHLKWDEQAIEEHDLLRGTRMKIDEPNTPYTHYDSGSESDNSRRPKSPANQKQTLSWDNLQTRLDSVAAVREQFPVPPSPNASHADAAETMEHSSDVEDETRKEMRVLEFQEHRKRHYNEMELVRQFRQQHSEDDEDDEVNAHGNGFNSSDRNGRQE